MAETTGDANLLFFPGFEADLENTEVEFIMNDETLYILHNLRDKKKEDGEQPSRYKLICCQHVI